MAENDKLDGEKTVLYALLGSLLVIVPVIYGFNAFMEWKFGAKEMAVRGQFGDQFGAVYALVSGLSFIALIAALAMQSRDLRAQTRSLKLQQTALMQQMAEFKEQKEEMRRSAAAQERQNLLTDLTLRLDIQKLRIQWDFTNASAFAINKPPTARRALENAEKRIAALDMMLREKLGNDPSIDAFAPTPVEGD